MKIWVDADACPKLVKEILFKAAKRTQTQIILVANQHMVVPTSPFIKSVSVPSGFDVADNYILQNVQANDLVITADIPLADGVVDRNAFVLTPRGNLLTKENIKLRLSIRNFSENLRSSGQRTGGPDPLSKKEIQLFANYLDQYLTVQSSKKV